jgi:nitroimidazol reductase NimA-like FMN-containing flavoprotein (pyridoxamine 5'-phosphate oxidase superfamily)
VQFEDGNVYVGMMPDSRKLNDLRRDPRLALHSATDDPPDDPAQWRGEAKLSGRAVEVSDPEKRLPAAGRFRIDIREVVLTHLNPRGDRLVVEAWHPSRGRNTLERE